MCIVSAGHSAPQTTAERLTGEHHMNYQAEILSTYIGEKKYENEVTDTHRGTSYFNTLDDAISFFLADGYRMYTGMEDCAHGQRIIGNRMYFIVISPF